MNKRQSKAIFFDNYLFLSSITLKYGHNNITENNGGGFFVCFVTNMIK